MLTPDQLQRLDDASAFYQFKASKAYSALKRILDEFEEQALHDLREYDGRDEKAVLSLVKSWHARCDLRRLIDIKIEEETGKFNDVAEELNIPLDELVMRRDIAHG